MTAYARSGHSLAHGNAAVFAVLLIVSSAVPLPVLGRDGRGPRRACVVKMACCLEGHCPFSSRPGGRGSRGGLSWNPCSSGADSALLSPVRTLPGLLPSPVRVAPAALVSRASIPEPPGSREAPPEVETPPPRTAAA